MNKQKILANKNTLIIFKFKIIKFSNKQNHFKNII